MGAQLCCTRRVTRFQPPERFRVRHSTTTGTGQPPQPPESHHPPFRNTPNPSTRFPSTRPILTLSRTSSTLVPPPATPSLELSASYAAACRKSRLLQKQLQVLLLPNPEKGPCCHSRRGNQAPHPLLQKSVGFGAPPEVPRLGPGFPRRLRRFLRGSGRTGRACGRCVSLQHSHISCLTSWCCR